MVQSAVPFALWIDTPNFASMSLPFRTIVILSTCLVASLAPEVRAQVLPISWTVTVAPGVIRQGKPFTALVRAQIPYSWHLYSTTQPPGGPRATTFTANGLAFAVQGRVIARKPDRAFDAIADINTETYSDSVTFRVPVVASRRGKQALQLTVRNQSCTDRFCTPERSTIVKAVVSVQPAAIGKQ